MKLGRKITIPANIHMDDAPIKVRRFGKHYEATIGIGKNYIAYLTLDEDALKALQKGEPVTFLE